MVADTFNVTHHKSVNLNDTFKDFESTNEEGRYPSDYLEGIAFQDTEPVDHVITDALRNKLFAEKGNDFGSDLLAINIQRGRDHGLPSYNEFRKICGLSELQSFDDLDDTIFNSDVKEALKDIYKYNES